MIVDYVGIASALKAAMKEYTKRDQSKYGDMNIAKIISKFKEKLQVCKDLLHGFDFSGFIGGSPLTMAKAHHRWCELYFWMQVFLIEKTCS